MLVLQVALLVAATGDGLVEAESPLARDPDGTSFARVFEERWASERACIVGFHARGRACWSMAADEAGPHQLWLRYASRAGGQIAVAPGPFDHADLVEVEVPATGAYEGKEAWSWTSVWTGDLEAGEQVFTVRGGPIRLDALWLGPSGAEPPALGPPPTPARSPELLEGVEAALRRALPAPAVRSDSRAPEWYESTRVSIHTRLSSRWLDRPQFTTAAESFASLGARAYVRHVRTMGEGAWWLTGVGVSEPWADADPVKAMVTRAHESELRLIAYYRHMEDRHIAKTRPEWLCRDDLGRPYDGRRVPHVCLNSPYGEQLLVRLEELVDRGVDGVYFDEHHQPREGCFCDNCRELWGELTGGAPFPEAIDGDDPLYRLLGLFTDVTVERFFERVRARISREELALLIGNNRSPDLFDRHVSTRLAGFADGVKTEYGTGDSHASRAFFSQHPGLWEPGRGARISSGWSICRDSAEGRPPHVWINQMRNSTEACAAAAAVVAWGGVANLDCKEARIPDAEVFQPAVELGNAIARELEGIRPVRWAAVHFPESSRDRTAGDLAAWESVLAATCGMWSTLLEEHFPAGFVTDGELRRGIESDVRILLLPAPGELEPSMEASVQAFVARGGHVVRQHPSWSWFDDASRQESARGLADALARTSLEPVRITGAPGSAQLVAHGEPGEEVQVVCLVNDPAWVWTSPRELPGGDPVNLPEGVDVVPPPLDADALSTPPGFRPVLTHPSIVVFARMP